MRVALQPASLLTPEVKQHYNDTIARPVRFDDYADIISVTDALALRQLFPGGAAQMWGITPGVGDHNVSQARRLRPGDFVMFYGGRKL